MTPHYADATTTVYAGDCLDVLRTLPDASVDAVVTDPPYGLGFMGREWDSIKAAHLPPSAQPKDSPLARMTTGKGPAAVAFDGVAFQAWCELWTAECFRVLKPGGHLLAFGGTRTWHRLACAVEDAGFEVRDSIAWLYGSGFPKSLDVSKAIDKAAGAEREVIGSRILRGRAAQSTQEKGGTYTAGAPSSAGLTKVEEFTAPATDAAREWQGWGSAMKPAFEPVVVARKPLIGTIASNVLTHGPGALNIDGCRIGGQAWDNDENLCASCAGLAGQSARRTAPASAASTATRLAAPTTSARDESAPADINRAATGCSAGTKAASTPTSSSTEPSGNNTTAPSLTDGSSTTSTKTSSTTALRTCTSCGAATTTRTTTSGSSAGRWPSNVVLDESQAAALDQMSGERPSSGGAAFETGGYGGSVGLNRDDRREIGFGDTGGASRFMYVAKADATERPRVNGVAHATVKPLALMRWLIRLVTPPGGTVLEPFAGSGTTGEACILEGFPCILIEREADYLPLILQRIHRRRDPVQAVRGAGEDGGLFDLLDGGSA